MVKKQAAIMDQKLHSALQFKQYSATSKSSFPNKNQTWHINIITIIIILAQ